MSRAGIGELGVMIERTPFMRLDGKQESWAEFKSLFQELMRASGQGYVLEMAQVTDKLPAEAKQLIAGITDPKEAWTQLVVQSAIHRLNSLRNQRRTRSRLWYRASGMQGLV